MSKKNTELVSGIRWQELARTPVYLMVGSLSGLRGVILTTYTKKIIYGVKVFTDEGYGRQGLVIGASKFKTLYDQLSMLLEREGRNRFLYPEYTGIDFKHVLSLGYKQLFITIDEFQFESRVQYPHEGPHTQILRFRTQNFPLMVNIMGEVIDMGKVFEK